MSSPKKAVIVVHGIGDQRQGDTLERLATSYVVNVRKAQPDTAHVRKSELWLRTHIDSGEDRPKIDTFKAAVLTADHLPDVLFAEVYWADISRILEGVRGFLLGVLQILTGLRFVVEAAGRSLVDQAQDGSARLVQAIGGVINRMLVGPLVALNALLLIVVLVTSWFETPIPRSLAFGGLSALFLFAIFALAQRKYLADETKRDAIISYVILAGILLVTTAINAMREIANDYTAIIEKVSDVFWSLLAVASFALILASIRVFQAHRDARPSLAIACAGPCLNVGLWALALSNLWIVGLQNILPGLDTHGEGGLVVRLFPLLSLLWLAVVAFVVVLGTVFVLRQRFAAKQQKVPGEPLRLIFSPWAVILLLVVITVWFVATVFAWLPVTDGDPVRIDLKFRDWTLDNIWLVIVVVGLLGLAASSVSRALDLLLDIITYFRRDSAATLLRPFGEIEDGDAQSTQQGLAFLKRQQIADRFRCLVSHMVRQENVGALTILAHSQGTITAIEQLKTVDQWLGTSIPRIELITIGSPYTHIYQHYFPGQFKAPGPKHVAKWINIYTVNDYVGTRVDDSAGSHAPMNIEREHFGGKTRKPNDLKPIGHNGYWTDEVVMEAIEKHAPF